jgi:DNA-binding CsgD family transcriptional regulator
MKQELYREAGIVEKLSVRSDIPSGFVLWSIYRQNKFFSKCEFDYLRDWADLLSATIANHLKIARVSLPLPQEQSELASLSLLRSSVERRGIHLSCRELSVCQGITGGATSKVIAADLGIKVSSVITYKRRIFEKFGVSTQRELIAILLNDILLRRGDDSQSRPASH